MKYPFKTKPHPHQVKALRKAVKNKGGAVFMPMRSGKTKVAIDWIGCMHLKYGAKRVLVVCPLSVVGVWKQQIRIHMPEEIKVQVLILNFEKVYGRKRNADGGWDPIPRQKIYRWSPDLIVVDEAHKIGHPYTVQSRELYKLQEAVDPMGKLILTGTPFHRKVHMVYGQFRFLDKRVFPESWSAFKRTYGKWGGYGGYKFLGPANLKQLTSKVRPLTFLMKTVPIVPPQHEVIPYKLKESEAAYKSMADDFIAWIGDGVVEAPIALVKALRLAQICGGRLKDSEGRIQRVGREKSRAFEGFVELLDENEVKKLVVFARFVPELKDIVKVCQKHGYKVYLMYGKTPGFKRERNIADFDEDSGKAVFVCQVSTGSLGIDLSSASVCVFYSLPESLVTFDQDLARIRKFKDSRTLSYYYMVGENTIEEAQLAGLRSNLDLIEVIERDPMLLSYETQG